MMMPRRVTVAVLLALAGSAFAHWPAGARGAETEPAAKCTEELVYARSEDGITNGGALFAPPKGSAKPVAVIWVHGSGVNFYYPTYVKIGRALAERGYACISVNTRMHDLGTIAGWRGEKRLRGGGYWGVNSEQRRDLSPRGSTLPSAGDSRRWCWPGTAPARPPSAITRRKSRTRASSGWSKLPGRFSR
jgi:hypothetical protein